MKNILIPLFFLTTLFANSQTIYTIPWATQQPKFVFPIFIEEGGGHKDTLYIGYDPNVSYISFDTTSQNYGVIPIHVDTNLFYAMWNAGGVYCGANTLCSNVYKANVCSLSPWGTFPSNASIFCNNGIMPLKFSWDNSVFYSDSLPFPNNFPAPRGWGRVIATFPFCGTRENYVTIPNNGFYIVDDSLGDVSDSITVFSLNSQTQYTNSGVFEFRIEAWNSPTHISIISSEDYFSISSLENSISILCLKGEIIATVYDLLGDKIFSKQIRSSESFTLPYLKPNLYLLIVNNQHIRKTIKIMSHEN